VSRSRDIDVRIERLVVHGLEVEPRHAARIHAGIRDELARLLEGDVSLRGVSDGAVPSMNAPALRLPPTTGPEAIGRAIAMSVHSLLSGGS